MRSTAFESDEAMLFGVVEPVAGHARADEPVELVDLDPHDLFNQGVAPLVQALDAELDGPACYPEEDETARTLHLFDTFHILNHLSVGECLVRQRHVDVPWRVDDENVEVSVIILHSSAIGFTAIKIVLFFCNVSLYEQLQVKSF